MDRKTKSKTSLYKTLGVGKEATKEEITKAYRKKAFELHPDRNPGDKKAETKFKQVQLAYEVLSDDGRRAEYDQTGNYSTTLGNGKQSEEAEILQYLQMTLRTVVQALIKDNGCDIDLRTRDLVADVRRILNNTRKEREDQINTMTKIRNQYTKIKGRFKKNQEKCETMETAVSIELRAIESGFQKIKAELDLIVKCTAALEGVVFTKDAQPKSQYQPYATIYFKPY